MKEAGTVRILHTADWHLGARLGAHERLEDQRGPCRQVVRIAEEAGVDVVVHAGDLFDQAQPPHAAVKLAAETLRELNRTGAATVVVCGNHDGAGLFDGLDTLSAPGAGDSAPAGRTRFITEACVLTATGTAGEPVVEIQCLPYFSPARAAEWLRQRGIEAPDGYGARIQAVAAASGTRNGQTDVPRIVCAHLLAPGAQVGGTERAATLGDELAVDLEDIGAAPVYEAWGHIHDRQAVERKRRPARYAGSLVPLGFAEDQGKTVSLVTLDPDGRVGVEEIRIDTPELLRFTGSVDDLERAAAGGAWNGRLVHARVESAERVYDLAERVAERSPTARVHRLVNVVENSTPEGLTIGDEDETEPPLRELYGEYRRSRMPEEREPDEAMIALFDEALRNAQAPGTSDFGIGALERRADDILARLAAARQNGPGAPA